MYIYTLLRVEVLSSSLRFKEDHVRLSCHLGISSFCSDSDLLFRGRGCMLCEEQLRESELRESGMPQNEKKQLDIASLIGETTAYDKKQALEERRPKSWCKSVCAFANGDGGALIFGVADDGTVVGLDNPEQDANKISEIIKSRLELIPEFRLRFE